MSVNGTPYPSSRTRRAWKCRQEIRMDEEEKKGMDFLWLVVIIAIWFLLQAIILPRLGIST